MEFNPDIKNERNPLIKYAMHYGLFLGLFWAVKYLTGMAVDIWVHFIYLYYLLNVGTFLLIYIFYIRYVEQAKVTSKFQGFKFVVLLCFFASFFEIAVMYLHFQFIDPGYFMTKIEPTIVKMIDSFPYTPEMRISAIEIASSKVLYLVSACIGNVLFGVFMGVLMAFLVKKKEQ